MNQNSQSQARILIVDDHAIMREGIATIINQEADLEVCGEAENPGQALEVLENEKPNLAIVDLSLKEGSGLELIKDIHSRYERLPILVLSMHDETIYAERAMHAGARGYVMKQESSDRVLEGIRQLLAGKTCFSKAVTEKVFLKAVDGRGKQPADPIETLTDRELEVFSLIGRGMKPRQIAEGMNLSVKTIESYTARIKQKLKLPNAATLLQHAIEWNKLKDT